MGCGDEACADLVSQQVRSVVDLVDVEAQHDPADGGEVGPRAVGVAGPKPLLRGAQLARHKLGVRGQRGAEPMAASIMAASITKGAWG